MKTVSPEIREDIERLVRLAGEKLFNAAPTPDTIHVKEGIANFVTDFDLEIQRFLIEDLSRILPEASFYCEEETEGSGVRVCRDGYIFYIDPIDGTTNFMFGYKHSCVSVALAYDKKIIAGYVYNPYTDEMYKAFRGEGSFLNGVRLTVKDRSIKDGIVAFGCARYQMRDTDVMFESLKRLFLGSICVRNEGSAALGLCMVASGNNACYYETRLSPYDYAAASIIIEEAGGTITQLDGSEISLKEPCSIVGAAYTAAKEVRAVVEQCRNEMTT